MFKWTVCSVCESKANKPHYLPRNKIRAQKWLDSLQIKNIDISKAAGRLIVCEKHFKDRDFQNERKILLNRTAVPFRENDNCSQQIGLNSPISNAKVEIINAENTANKNPKNFPKRSDSSIIVKETTLENVREEAHFEKNQFELKRADGWIKLRPNAVPTLFYFIDEFKNENIQEEEKKNKHEIKNKISTVKPLAKVEKNCKEESVLSSQKTCRTCLTVSDNTQPLDSNIINRISEISSFKIEESDPFTKSICLSCLEKLNSAYEFIKQLNETQDKISELANALNESINTFHDSNNLIDHEDYENVDDPDENNGKDHNVEIQTEEKQFSDRDAALILLEALRPQTNASQLCSICGKLFTSKKNCQAHLSLVHSHQLPKYECPTCGKRFLVRKRLNAHVKFVHEKSKPFVCELCGERYKCMRGLRTHHRRDHSTDQKPKRIPQMKECPICRKTFRHQGLLNMHNRCHTGERPYRCHYCNRGFAYKRNLRTHLRIHTNERPYHCVQCEATFRYNTSLKSHMKSTHNT